MQGSQFDELAFFSAIAASGARALLIGRRALIALGLPVMTSDYDYWVARDDMARFNEALEPFGLVPSRTPDEAIQHGRYSLENDEKVDVLVARAVATVDGIMVAFDDIWPRRRAVDVQGIAVLVPAIDDLIATKKFGARVRDVEDIRALELFKLREGS